MAAPSTIPSSRDLLYNSVMREYKEHYHCFLCGDRYPTKEEADECFWNHSELEILRWIAFELVSSRHFAELNQSTPCADEISFTTEFLKKLNDRFKVAEIDEKGLVWSLAIKGKRV